MPAFHIPLAAAYVIITAVTGIIWSSLVWLIRLFVRLKIRGPFGWDDTLCTIATILAIINSSIVIRQSHYGLGQHIGTLSPALIEKQQLLSWIAGLLYILALCFAMLSICCLIIRITTHTGQGWIAKTIAAVGIIWAVVAFFLIAFICKLPHPWITRPLDRCVDIVSLAVQSRSQQYANTETVSRLDGHRHRQFPTRRCQYRCGCHHAMGFENSMERKGSCLRTIRVAPTVRQTY